MFLSAKSAAAVAYFSAKLTFETDCSDVFHALQQPDPGFVLLHVVGSASAFGQRHIPGSIHLPHRDITAQRMMEWSDTTNFVVYCAGPHCNGADKAALRLAELGRPVRLMIGGLTGWENEGLPFARQA